MTTKRSRPSGQGKGGNPNMTTVTSASDHAGAVTIPTVPFIVCADPHCESSMAMNPSRSAFESLRVIEAFGWVLTKWDVDSGVLCREEIRAYCSRSCLSRATEAGAS
jgi:hypothetical protein